MEAEMNKLRRLESNEIQKLKIQNEELRKQIDVAYHDQRNYAIELENLRSKFNTMSDSKSRLEQELIDLKFSESKKQE